MNNERWLEQQKERFEDDILGYILEDDRISSDFLCFIEEKDPQLMQKWINSWLETPYTKKWVEKIVGKIIDSTPDGPEHDD